VDTGDWVFTNFNGWMKVTGFNLNDTYSITLNENDSRGGDMSCLINGKYHIKDKYPSVWTYCPFDPPIPKPVEFPNFEIDHPVLVRSNTQSDWKPRHFAFWPEKKLYGIYCFRNGRTHFTVTKDNATIEQSLKQYTFWIEWKDAKE
jgi:hypothetical protein